jgi:hypothetical protein
VSFAVLKLAWEDRFEVPGTGWVRAGYVELSGLSPQVRRQQGLQDIANRVDGGRRAVGWLPKRSARLVLLGLGNVVPAALADEGDEYPDRIPRRRGPSADGGGEEVQGVGFAGTYPPAGDRLPEQHPQPTPVVQVLGMDVAKSWFPSPSFQNTQLLVFDLRRSFRVFSSSTLL